MIFNRNFLCYQCEGRLRIIAQLRLLCAGQLGQFIAACCLVHQLIILDGIGVLCGTTVFILGRLIHLAEDIAFKRDSVLRHGIRTVNQVLLAVPVLAFVVFRVCRYIRCTGQRKRFCFCVFVFVYHHGFRRNCARHRYCRLTVLPLIGGLHGEFRTCGIRLTILCYGVVYGRYRTVCFLLFTDADISQYRTCLTFYLVNIQRHAAGFYGARNGCLYGFCRGFNRVEITLTDIRGILSAAALRSTGYRQAGGCLRCTDRQRCRIAVERNRRCRLGITRYHAAVHRTIQFARYRLYGIGVLRSTFNIRPLSSRQTLLPLIIRARKFCRSRSLHTESCRAVQRNGYFVRSIDNRTAHLIRQRLADNDLAFNRLFLTGIISGSDRILILFVRRKILQLIRIFTTR